MPALFICSCGRRWWQGASPTSAGLRLTAVCPDCGAITAGSDDEAARPALPETVAPDAGACAAPDTVAYPAHAASPSPVVAPPGYEVVRELGRGGMGVVYLARQLRAGRLVALKMTLSGGHADEGERTRFRTEAEAVARLQHPNIVQVYEVGEHEGRPFFSLEYCHGGSLDRKLGGIPLQPRDAAALVEKLARGIQAAHQASVLHRDLKPANVLLAADGTPKVTDFGLAKKLDEQGATVSGAVMGTPSYMAPEQADGKKGVGPAADVYALGALLYECLTGRPPFRAATLLDTLQQVTGREPVPPRQLNARVPRDLETITLKCLRKEPGKRYASAAELADDLGRYLRGQPVRARRTGPVERVVKWVRRNPLGAALALALAAGTAVSAWFAVDASRQAAEARKNADDLAREKRNVEQARDEAEGMLVDGLLRTLSPLPGPLQDVEIDTLSRLRRLPSDRVCLRFLREGLATAEAARRLDRRAEWVVHALVGQDRRRRRQAQEVVLHALRDPSAPEEVRAACVSLGVALETDDPEFAEHLRRVLLAETGRRLSRNDLEQLPAKLRGAGSRLDESTAGAIAASLAAALEQTSDGKTAASLFAALQAVSDRLGPAAARAGADAMLRAYGRFIDALRVKSSAGDWQRVEDMTRSLARVIGRLPGAEAAGRAGQAADSLAAVLRWAPGAGKDELLPYNLARLSAARALAELRELLDGAALHRLADALLPLLDRERAGHDLASAGEALEQIGDRIDPTQAGRLARALLAAIAHPAPTPYFNSLINALRAVSRSLTDQEAAALLDDLQASLEKAGSAPPATLQRLVHSLQGMSGRLDPPRAARLTETLLNLLARGTPCPIVPVSQVLAAAGKHLGDTEAAAVAARVTALSLATIPRTTNRNNLYALIEAVRTLSDRLDGGQARKVSDALLAVLQRGADWVLIHAVAQTLAALHERLAPAARQAQSGRLADVALEAMGRTTDDLALTYLAQSLALVGRGLDAAHARRASDALLARMSPSRDAAFLVSLGADLVVINSRLAESLARANADRAWDVLVTRLSRTPEEHDPFVLDRAFRRVCERWGTDELTDRSRHLLAAGRAQRLLLDVLGRRHHREFRTAWHFLDWSASNGVELAPPEAAGADGG